MAEKDLLELISAAVFGITLVLLYAASALYHFTSGPCWKARFQTLDHVCIYLLIAGSYTPFTLITLRGNLGWALFVVVWSLALAGGLFKTLSKWRKDNWLSTALYLVMGWLVLVAIAPLIRNLTYGGMAWLAAGGLAYTVGVVFFAWRSLPYNHAIWHLFVLGGSACHVLAVCLFVL